MKKMCVCEICFLISDGNSGEVNVLYLERV